MITENKNNYYDILEVSSSATQHDILIAYQRAKKTYSEKNHALRALFSTDELNDLVYLIEEAYSVLSNQNYRTIYEQRLVAKSYSASDVTFSGIKESTNAHPKQSMIEKLVQKHHALQTKEEVVATEATHSDLEPEPCAKSAEFESEMENQKLWSGDFLKKVREYRNISFEKLHESTKVNPWYLKAIESMDFKNLPAEVFVRGYVLQVAKQLGLKEKEVADSYMVLFKAKQNKEKTKSN